MNQKDIEVCEVSPELTAEFTHMVLTFYYRMQEHPINAPDIKLSSHAFHVLYILSENPEHKVPMAELVKRIRRTKQQLSKLVSTLEDDGLVTRIRIRENRRMVYVALTAEGAAFTRQAADSMVQAMSDFLNGLPKEKLPVIADITAHLTKLAKETEI